MTSNISHAMITQDQDQRGQPSISVMFFKQILFDLPDDGPHFVQLGSDEGTGGSGKVSDVIQAQVVEDGHVPVVALKVSVG